MKSGKGLPPQVASYITGSDHRRKVEAADTRLAKRKVTKQRRELDRQIVDDDSLPEDVRKARHSKNATGPGRDKTRKTPA